MKNNCEKILSLAVNFGFSHDLQENCQKFFSELRKTSKCLGVAVWFNNYPTQSQATYAFYGKNGFYHKDNKVFLPEYPLEIPESKDFLRLLPEDELFEEFMVEGCPLSGCVEIYKLSELGFIQLFYKDKPETQQFTNCYFELFSHFAAFLKLCLRHEKLENECKESHCILSGLNQSDVIVILTDSLGQVKFVNNAFTSIYGYKREEILNRPFETILSHLPDKDKIVEIRRLLKLKKRWSGRIKNTIRNGELKDFYISIAPFQVQGKNGRGNIIFFKDITSEILLEENLNNSKKLQAVSTMAASIVSDFETILGDVTGALKNANDSTEVSQNLKALLADNIAKIDGAQQLLRQLKLFSCNIKPEENPVEVARILDESIKILRASLPVTIDLITEVDYRGHVKADANQLQQIILKLGTNAFKAIRNQGEIRFKLREPSLYELQLLCKKRPGSLWICLEIKDNGCGISPENIERIFDPFFTSSKINNNSGLGLAVIQAMVERMGGCVRVESKVEEGSKFVICLPLSESHESAEVPEISTSLFGQARIIVVDDEEMICKIYRMGLKKYGYKVTSFTDSERALKAFQHRPGNFDLLITDMVMPKIDGNELTRQILAIRPDLPVILCSGFISELDEQELMDSGIKMYIEKPLEVAELDKAIKSLLD